MFEYDKGQTEIKRDGLRTTVAVTARAIEQRPRNGHQRNQGETGEGCEATTGNDGRVWGLYREQQSSFRELLLALGLAVALVL
jgi:hypothetical protein